MGIVTAQMDPMNVIALPLPAVRINSDVTTANVFRVICSAVVRLNAMTRPMKRLAMVLENFSYFFSFYFIFWNSITIGRF
jgi:hypothetical protein